MLCYVVDNGISKVKSHELSGNVIKSLAWETVAYNVSLKDVKRKPS